MQAFKVKERQLREGRNSWLFDGEAYREVVIAFARHCRGWARPANPPNESR